MELEEAMWQLYLDFEQEFENTTIFNPGGDLAAMPAIGAPVIPVNAPLPGGAGNQPGTQGGLPPGVLSMAAMMVPVPKEKTYDLVFIQA
jgi:hypothetical protein